MIGEAFEGGGDPTAADLESVFKLVVTVGNAKVTEQIGRGPGFAEELERLMLDPSLPPKAEHRVKLMLERKTTRFPDDLRFISDFKVYTAPDGEMRVKAKARLASELRHEH
jgi:hypothetical protein